MSVEKYVLEKLIEIEAKVQVLEAKVTGQQHVINMLATRLCELSPESKKRTLALLKAMTPYAEFAAQPASGAFVLATVEAVEALTSAEKADVTQVLTLQAMMAANAGPARQAALADWLAHAMPEEIAQELQQLLAQHKPVE